MDRVFEMRLPAPDDGRLKSLHELSGDSFENVLEIAVIARRPEAGESCQRGPGGEQTDSSPRRTAAPSAASGERLAYRQLGLIGPEVYTNWEFVFDQQVTRWITAIADRRENPALLRRFSPALYDLSLRLDDFEPAWADVPFMRTVRMLILLEALLMPEMTFDTGPQAGDRSRPAMDWRAWRSRLHQAAAAIRSRDEHVREIVDGLSGARIPIDDTGWHVSIPLLMLVAVVYSQYEYYASVLWQADSALRAHDELERKWQTALERIPVLGHCRDLVALLIRHQSAVGKLVRQSGGGKFLLLARRFAERTDGAFSPSTVLDALGLMSILEEARLRQVPGTEPNTPIGRCKLNAGTIQPWQSEKPLGKEWYLLDPEEVDASVVQALGSSAGCLDPLFGRVFRSEGTLRRTLEECLKSGSVTGKKQHELVDRLVRAATQTAESSIRRIAAACRTTADAAPTEMRYDWLYASRLEVCDDQMRAFQRLVERHWQSLLSPDGAALGADVAAFSFGLSQTRDLKPLLARCVGEVAQAVRNSPERENEQAALETFGRHFRLCPTAVACGRDCSRSQGDLELVVEVLLREELAAWGLLFPRDRRSGSAGGDAARSSRRSAADLLSRLFQKAASSLALDEGALHGKRYVPFPLFERMLEVVARLRPTESLSVTLRFDGRRRRQLRFPTGLDQRRHEHLVSYIANYVHAVVLNRAMTKGFHTCDVSFDGLDDAAAGESRRAGQMTANKWKDVIRRAYRRNCYGVLVDKYLRDYNTERRSVELLDVSRPTTLRRTSPEMVPGELERWMRAHPRRARDLPARRRRGPEEDAADGQLVLGLDVGATLTKIRFYSVRGARLQAVGGAYQLHTPSLTGAARLSGNGPADRFAAELARGVEQVGRSDRELKARFEGGGAIVRCVGVAWPGPVRANHVAGTSKILANFPPLSRQIVSNQIDDILDLDIPGAVRRQFKRSGYLTGGREPLAALLNDGDAAGYGTVMIDGRLPGRRLAVVEIGTGTATAVLDDGQPIPGPCEGGKVILDLGATPAKECSLGYEFPTGVANAFLSRKLLPAVAEKLVADKGLDFRVDRLRNREIGLFLLSDPRPLRNQCGLRDLAEEHSVGMEILRRVLDKKEEAEINLQHQVERILNVPGKAAVARLQQLVEARGLIRLAEVLRLPTDWVCGYFDGIDKGTTHPRAGEVEKRMKRFRQEVAEPSVRAMGTYLGDFLVLLATQYGVDAFIVAGGLLRDRTGEPVREAAIERAGRYGFTLRLSGSLLEIVKRPPWMAGAQATGGDETSGRADQPDDSHAAQHRRTSAASQTGSDDGAPSPADRDAGSDPGYGTAGAAIFAAGELLLREKQKGLERLRSKVFHLGTNKWATLSDDAVRFDDEGIDDVLLADHALTAEEVEQFLVGQRTVVQSAGPEGTTRYVRVTVERSQAFEM